MTRIVLHIDMDCFFAQIEERENPRFKGKPVVIGADPKKGRGRGVVSTANYEARKYGIHSALPISKAFQLCPEAVFLSPNLRFYRKVSESIFETVKDYSSQYEIVSSDEAYLDISFLLAKNENLPKAYKEAGEMADKLKKEIFIKEKLTSTIGIGPNKLIAKIASQQDKPNGLLVILPQNALSFLSPLDIEIIPGIGPKTARQLRKLGVNKVREIRRFSKEFLQENFGKWGVDIYHKTRAVDRSPVKGQRRIKSVGREYTFPADTRKPEIIFSTFEKIIENIYKRATRKELYFKTITVKCRFSNFQSHSKSITFKKPTNQLRVLERESKILLLKLLVKKRGLVRLIGVRVSNLSHKN